MRKRTLVSIGKIGKIEISIRLKKKKKISRKITQMRQPVISTKQFQLCPRFLKQSQY